MIKLFTEKEFENAKGVDKLPLKCEYCGKTFYEYKKMIKFIENHEEKYKNAGRFCSHSCSDYFMHREQNQNYFETICSNCGKIFKIQPSKAKKSKSGNHFCSKSCAVTYNNKHKEFGTRRSKLEEYLEKKLSLIYPDLEILYNDKKTINSELDIYIPAYKLAFELNGIFHYEPIFGNKKLNEIQNNDKNKFQLCQENNISLCTIDTSALKYFKENSAKKYLDIVQNIINENIARNSEN